MAYVKYDHRKRLLTVSVDRAPGRRAHEVAHKQFREEIWRAAQKAAVPVLNHEIKLSALFTNPESPDVDNLLVALCRALDGKTGDKSKALLGDDGQIVGLREVDVWFKD
jgi:hypothetical protein